MNEAMIVAVVVVGSVGLWRPQLGFAACLLVGLVAAAGWSM